MLIGIIGILCILVMVILYGCLRTSTAYDEEVEDEMQEAFLRQYKKDKLSNHEHTETSEEK